MKKVIFTLIVLGVLGSVALGLINMVIGIPVSESYSSITVTSAEMELAKEVIGAKCLMVPQQGSGTALLCQDIRRQRADWQAH